MTTKPTPSTERGTTMRSQLLIAAAILGLVASVGIPAAAADPWQVTLTDGTRLEGTLLRTAPARYILQTATTLYELTDDDLDPRTFSARAAREAVPVHAIHDISHYDEINADGTVTAWWVRSHVNDSQHAIAENRFGLAPWEQLEADQRAYRDGFGNVMVPVYDPPRDRWPSPPTGRVQITLKYPVPVAPGETAKYSGSRPGTPVERRGDQFVYRAVGDYAEDNLVSLKVRLPRGAQVVSATPTASARFEVDGFEYLVWRRFYSKGERYPLEVVYTLN